MPDSNVAIKICFRAEGWSGTTGSLTWMLMPDGRMTISGVGAMPDYAAASDVPWAERKALIRALTVESGVTSIGKCAFSDCTSLESVSLPDTVTVIDEFAFSDCTALTSIFYEGSHAMWNAITIGNYNDSLQNAALSCRFALTFETCDGPDIIDPILFNQDEIPPRPEYKGTVGAWFAGWYLDDTHDTPYDFDYPLNADTMLYAGYVWPDPLQTLRLPNALTVVEDEAFAGTAAVFIAVPDTVTNIADNAFPTSEIYILGYPGSTAEGWADAHSIPFIEINDEWLADH